MKLVPAFIVSDGNGVPRCLFFELAKARSYSKSKLRETGAVITEITIWAEQPAAEILG